MSLGFKATETGKPCTHLGAWNFRDMGRGMMVRYCEGCGSTYILAQMPDTSFALIQVPEFGLEKWDELSVVAEDVSGVQDDEAEQPVSPGPADGGRETQPVQDVQESAVRDSDAAPLPREEGAA